MSVLDDLDWAAVREMYDSRKGVHRLLGSLVKKDDSKAFVRLALGIDDEAGNYSASDHGLGKRILGSNGADPWSRIRDLANELAALDDGRLVPDVIRRAGIRYLGVSVGSEMGCLVNPVACWVTNTRTVWAHLLVKHGDDIQKANRELALYRESDADSAMDYQLWAGLHPELNVSLTRIAEMGGRLARKEGVKAGAETYLWADAIANELYAHLHV